VPDLYVSRISLVFIVRSNNVFCSNIQTASRYNSDILHNVESTCVLNGRREWLIDTRCAMVSFKSRSGAVSKWCPKRRDAAKSQVR
jgi:hypothetical protein